jgi:hypothetical protein
MDGAEEAGISGNVSNVKEGGISLWKGGGETQGKMEQYRKLLKKHNPGEILAKTA